MSDIEHLLHLKQSAPPDEPPATGGGADVTRNASRQRIGLALGGGGLWGAAHAGVADVLEKEGVPIHMIAGASMGAIVGGALTASTAADGTLSRQGVDHLIDTLVRIRTLEQLRETAPDGRVVMPLKKLLTNDGASDYGNTLLAARPQIPFWAQVAEAEGDKRNELFLAWTRFETLEEALSMMAASAALKPKFGYDPVNVHETLYRDDTSIAWKSNSAATRHLRHNGATQVIGAPVSFVDTDGPGRWIQRFMDFFSSTLADRGDHVIRSKEGRGPFSGSESLTNFGKGNVLWPQKFARNEGGLASGRIQVPMEEFIEAGRAAARKVLPQILNSLE